MAVKESITELMSEPLTPLSFIAVITAGSWLKAIKTVPMMPTHFTTVSPKRSRLVIGLLSTTLAGFLVMFSTAPTTPITMAMETMMSLAFLSSVSSMVLRRAVAPAMISIPRAILMTISPTPSVSAIPRAITARNLRVTRLVATAIMAPKINSIRAPQSSPTTALCKRSTILTITVERTSIIFRNVSKTVTETEFLEILSTKL